MRCLIVKAHPLADSLCSSISRRITDHLRSVGHEVTVEDLYVEKFEAAMTADERSSYYDGPYLTKSVQLQVDHLLFADAIVLVFPTWWFGFPAILKGWFDRVWGPGVAYDHASDYGPIQPRLNNLRRMLVVTSLGAPWWVDCIVLRQPLKRILNTAIIRTCAPNCRFQMLSLYKSESLTPIQVDKFWSRVKRTLSRW